jgi:HKD family nuclease
VDYDAVDVAVAYASRRGVSELSVALTSSRWLSAGKRWLVSMDFGRTEPAALDALAALPNSEVRVPNGRDVIASQSLQPKITFHTKAYLFRLAGHNCPVAVIIGSANLT